MSRNNDVLEALGAVGVWSRRVGGLPFSQERETVREIEALGYGAIWIPEGVDDKEALSHAALLLGATERIVIATGIASIWARDPVAMANGANALAEAFPGRFILGLGISHVPEVKTRGLTYQKPLETMRSYLESMEQARLRAPGPPQPLPRLLAALAPRMLELARAKTDGSHPYFVPVSHTTFARQTLGDDPILAPEQAVVVETRPDVARRVARDHMRHYLTLDNYRRNLLRLGWAESDLAEGGSDALVDEIVAWGSVQDMKERVRAHHEAGADHVSIQPLEGGAASQLEQLRELASVLLDRPPAAAA